MRGGRRAETSLLQSKDAHGSSSLLLPSGMGEEGLSPGDGIPVEGICLTGGVVGWQVLNDIRH